MNFAEQIQRAIDEAMLTMPAPDQCLSGSHAQTAARFLGVASGHSNPSSIQEKKIVTLRQLLLRDGS